jgi:Fe2+ transport system protein FeoA
MITQNLKNTEMFKLDNNMQISRDKEKPLNQFKRGETSTVKRFNTKEDKTLQKFLAMGIVPGRIISVKQTYPVFILQIDKTQAAMDKELAENIIMQT